MWIDHYLGNKFNDIRHYGPLQQELNRVVIGDHEEKPVVMLKQKKLCSVLFAMEILLLLIMPWPFFDCYIKGEKFDTFTQG